MTATPQTTFGISGTATDLSAGTPLAGFTVTVGNVPTSTTCLATQTATTQPCGVPASPLPTVTTSSTGAFAVTVPSAGTYMLTIAKDGTYATLHRTVAVTTGITSLGTVNITALGTAEQAWLADVNNQRATVSVPASFPNLVVDEYAEEEARQWAMDVVSGKTAYSDAAFAPYQAAYGAAAGSLYGATGVLNTGSASAYPQYLGADTGWMSEMSNCAGKNWQTCTDSALTGHYIRMSNSNTVWIGLGEYANSSESANAYYDLMLIENVAAAGPA